ncbi:MAG: glycoside hydrolase family 27 protein [Acidobacteriota bacterium]|nr:glycoside hydrolase family 27 protein [Acidobacteriota bacterium]
MKRTIALLIILFCVLIIFMPRHENLAQTPPMGWNSWNSFACNIDEDLIKKTADALVSSGMKDAGYQYVIIDDCWQGERDASGFIQPNAQRFPSGMKALGDYIHSKGLKFGIYSDVGVKTCDGMPGSRGYEYRDAATYAGWGVDYLKYDWCDSEYLNVVLAYTTMRDALYATKRPIVFSICEWGKNKPWEWAKSIGQLWRTTGDITHCWDCEEKHPDTASSWGIMRILDKQKGLRVYAAPGNWNDPDMLEVGNGMTISEDRAHFSMWAMLAAPLIAGNDLREMSNETREILTNKEIIAVNQDALGIEAFPAISEDDLEIWAKPLSNGDWAICFLNRGSTTKNVSFDWKENLIKDDFAQKQFDAKKDIYKIRDLWAKKDLGTTDKTFQAVVQPHDVAVLRLSK